jgi:hypothetical protein
MKLMIIWVYQVQGVFVCNSVPQGQTVNALYHISFLRYQHGRQLSRISQNRLEMPPSCMTILHPIQETRTFPDFGVGKK